eukprot:2472626-Rhodomonas_salina.1
MMPVPGPEVRARTPANTALVQRKPVHIPRFLRHFQSLVVHNARNRCCGDIGRVSARISCAVARDIPRKHWE